LLWSPSQCCGRAGHEHRNAGIETAPEEGNVSAEVPSLQLELPESGAEVPGQKN